MRKTVLLVASVTAMLLLVSVAALADVIYGTDGNDELTGTGRPDFLYGYGGNDTIYGQRADDELWGGLGNDSLKGGPTDDLLQGEGGDDIMNGGIGDDELRGGDGKDRLNASDGNDRLYDRSGDADADTFVCGAGMDTVKADANDIVRSDCETVNADGQDLLPDLGMAQVQDLQIENRVDGSRWLLFSSNIVNIGAGNFEVTGRRPPGGSVSDMTTTQRIYDSAGDYRDRSTDATFFYSGDGHEHWHVRNLEDYELFPAGGGGAALATSPKNGFCFYDNQEYGSTAARVYGSAGCAPNDPEALSVTMGLSRGWGDRYGPQQYGQGINVTSLPDGLYRLVLTADGANWFLESDETNNLTWADLQITGNTVTVLQYGPSAPPVS